MSDLSPAQPNPPEPSPEMMLAIEEQFERITASSSTSGPLETAVANAIDKDHLTKIIEQGAQRETNRHKEVSDARTGSITALLVAGALVIGLTWLTLSYGKPEVIVPIITAIVGAAGGYGWGKSSKAVE